MQTLTNVRGARQRRLTLHLERSLREAAEALEQRHQDLGRRIRAARDAKKWKQKELAAAVHVEPVTVSRWENGRNLPDTHTIEKIAEALDVTFSDLIPRDPSLQEQGMADLRDEVRALRDDFAGMVARLDSLLAERDPPRRAARP